MPAVLFLVPLSASLASLHSVYWFFPVCLGLISLGGFFIKKFFLLDSGILLSLLSFLFAYRGTELTLTSLLVLIVLIFLYFGAWTFSRNGIIVKEILDVLDDVPLPDSFVQFRKSSLNETMTSMFMGIFISILGFSIASFSAFDISRDLQVPMIVVFSVVAFLITYMIFLALPSE